MLTTNTIDAPPRTGRAQQTRGLTCSIFKSIGDVPLSGLAELIRGEPESWDYYRAIETVPPPGFTLGALAAVADGRTVAMTPLFRTRYRLDTPLQGGLRRVSDWINARRPNVTSISVLGLGSPMSDNLTIGFAPRLSAKQRTSTFDAMLHCLRDHAVVDKRQMIAVKSIDHLAGEMHETFAKHDFNCVTSVPLVMLDMPFRSLDDYYASLPRKTALYLQRKYRTADNIRMQYVDEITGYEDDIYQLFQSTLSQSKVSYGDFQELDPGYFGRVKAELGDQAQFQLCWHDNKLVSFQFFIWARDRIVAKQIGMKYPAARELNLYFIAWIELIKFAIEQRIPKIEMGATTYATKLLFGGYLERRSLYFRFRRDVSNTILSPLAPLFDFESNDPDLKKLKAANLQNMRGR